MYCPNCGAMTEGRYCPRCGKAMPVMPEPESVIPEPVRPAPEKQEPVKPEPVKQEPVKQEPVKPEPVKQEPIIPQPAPEPVEAEEEQKEPSRGRRLLRPWEYFGYSVLFMIPVIGWIFFLVFTFNKRNMNRYYWVRSIWCGILVLLVLAAVCVILIYTIPGALDLIRAYLFPNI